LIDRVHRGTKIGEARKKEIHAGQRIERNALAAAEATVTDPSGRPEILGKPTGHRRGIVNRRAVQLTQSRGYGGRWLDGIQPSRRQSDDSPITHQNILATRCDPGQSPSSSRSRPALPERGTLLDHIGVAGIDRLDDEVELGGTSRCYLVSNDNEPWSRLLGPREPSCRGNYIRDAVSGVDGTKTVSDDAHVGLGKKWRNAENRDEER
jgi:hypothetical protein